jgi:thiol:disulfide interchange protein DsbD
MKFKSLGRAALVPLLALAMALGATPLAAQDDGLLQVTDAFRLTADATTPGVLKLHWTIADHYYLYRGRIHAKALDGAIKLGTLDLPDGQKEHDQFLGDVEIYHGSVDATLPYTVLDAGAKTLNVAIQFQGCHEVDPKICYPPHTQKLVLPLPSATTHAGAASAAITTTGQPALLAGRADTAAGTNAPLPPEQAFRFEAIATAPDALLLRWTMPKHYYLYRDRTTLKLVDGTGIVLGTPAWPGGVAFHDKYAGDSIVYFDQVDVPVPLQRAAGAADTLTLQASFQGCQEEGICYPVMTRTVKVALAGAASAATAAGIPIAAEAAPTTSQSEAGGQSAEQQLAGGLLGNGRWLALLGFFAAGLGLAFTPCVLPMIPILSGLIAGAGAHISTRRAFVLSLVYVLASCVVFTIAGVIAGVAGANLQAAFQTPWILWCFALLFVLLALSMFGFYELQLPASLQTRLANVSNRQKSGSLVGVAIMGVLSALIVGPCVAPPLAGAVLYIAQTHDAAFGGLALFLLSLGMGVPLLVFGTAAGRWLPHTGPWMVAVKAVFGVVFLGLAIWMLSRILDPLWIMLMSGALLVACAVYMGAFERLAEGGSGWRRLWKALGLIALIAGAAELVGAAAGSRNLLQPLSAFGGHAASNETKLAFRTVKSVDDLDRAVAAASAAGQPVMLDFYADWCVSCKEMEAFTFTDPAVRQALSGVVLLRADVTANDAADQALLKHFGLFGPPATIFYGPDGKERRALRLIGFEKVDAFVARVDKARG